MILSATDKPAYFPEVAATGVALDGLLAVAEAIATGENGSKRDLSLTTYTEIRDVTDGFVLISRLPLVAVTKVETRYLYDTWGRQAIADWTAINNYKVDAEDGKIWLPALGWGRGSDAKVQAKVSYQTGFDFAAASPTEEVRKIKACVGRIVSFVNTNKPLGLQSLSNTTSTVSTAESYFGNTYLALFLMPLRKYAPRSL